MPVAAKQGRQVFRHALDRVRGGAGPISHRQRRCLCALYQVLFASGLLAEALPSRARVASIGRDGRWFLDHVVGGTPRFNQPCSEAQLAQASRCDLLRVVLDGRDATPVHHLLPALDVSAPLVLFEVPRAQAGVAAPVEQAVRLLLGELDYTVDLAGVAEWRDGRGSALLVGVHPRRLGPRAQWEVARFDMDPRRSSTQARLAHAGDNAAR
jgi:hypothetical protein